MHGCGGDVGDTLLVLVLMLVLLLMVVMVRNTLLVLVLILGLLLILVIILAMVEIPYFHCPDSRHQRSLKTSTCWVRVVMLLTCKDMTKNFDHHWIPSLSNHYDHNWMDTLSKNFDQQILYLE